MIISRIIDNDMGKVLKVPLTGRGTIHGITVVIDAIKLPEIDISLLDFLSVDRGVARFTKHVEEHISKIEDQSKFIDYYKKWVK
jgi:hypothetical protein